jgi:protein-L-isoaspartate(D-aspartate) O-methyltransferase
MRRWLSSNRADRTAHDGAAHPNDWAATQLERRGIHDQTVLRAMRSVPRERFVPPDLVARAYEDGALPIGSGQTISQPYIVALMTEALALGAWSEAHDGQRPKVLDVGTGSGYQAAVLAALQADVVSIEREPELAERARDRLEELGYEVKVIVGDGSAGAPDEAPFAGIVVAAAAPDVPPPLVDELEADGRLVIPIGSRLDQTVTLVQPRNGGFSRTPIETAVFVPLLGEHGFSAG